MSDRDVMQTALEALLYGGGLKKMQAITALRARLAEPVSVEPLKWFPSPRKTEWGFGMVCADVEIDRDHTLTLYCEEDQTAKVDAMLSPTRRPLTPVQEAAPELLEALKAVQAFIEGEPDAVWPTGIIRAAISKAEGARHD